MVSFNPLQPSMMPPTGGMIRPNAPAFALDAAACSALMNSTAGGAGTISPSVIGGTAAQTSGGINYPTVANAATPGAVAPQANAAQSAMMMVQAIMGMIQGGGGGNVATQAGGCSECSAVPCTCNTAPVDMRPMAAPVSQATPATAPAATPVAAPAATPAVSAATPAAAPAAQPNVVTQLKAQLNPTNNAQINQMIDMSSKDADVMKLMIAAANDGTKISFGNTSANVNGFYQPGTRAITLGNKLAGTNGALDTFIHELGHAATRGDGNSLNEEARNEAFATVKADQLLGRTTPNANKIFTDTVALYKRTAGQSNLGQDNNAARAFAGLGINLGTIGLNALG